MKVYKISYYRALLFLDQIFMEPAVLTFTVEGLCPGTHRRQVVPQHDLLLIRLKIAAGEPGCPQTDLLFRVISIPLLPRSTLISLSDIYLPLSL